MNRSKNVISVNNHIPYRPRLYTHDEKDIDVRFLEDRYNKVIFDPDDYFARVKFLNFDIINHECRVDELEHDRDYYETLFKKNVEAEIVIVLHRDSFVSAARRCERQDVRLEKDLLSDHFKNNNLKEQLKQKGVYLSAMQNVRRLQTNVKLSLFSSFNKNDW